MRVNTKKAIKWSAIGAVAMFFLKDKVEPIIGQLIAKVKG